MTDAPQAPERPPLEEMRQTLEEDRTYPHIESDVRPFLGDVTAYALWLEERLQAVERETISDMLDLREETVRQAVERLEEENRRLRAELEEAQSIIREEWG